MLAPQGLPNPRVLLIGGAGFIGHTLALALRARGGDVLIVDDFSVNHLRAPEVRDRPGINRDLYLTIAQDRLDRLGAASVPILEQDARNGDAVTRIVADYQPTAVVVLAAVGHSSRSNAHPHRAFESSARTLRPRSRPFAPARRRTWSTCRRAWSTGTSPPTPVLPVKPW